MVRISKFYLNYGRLRKDFRYRISDGQNPVFSWATISGRNGAYQSAYRIIVKHGAIILWDSGKTESRNQSAAYDGNPLPAGVRLNIHTVIWDDAGNESEEYTDYFYNGAIAHGQG